MTNSEKKDKTALFEEMEQRLVSAEKDLKEVKRFAKKLKEINKNLKKLSGYYHSDWLEDLEEYEQKENNERYYRMMGQDAIWDVTQQHYEQKLRLLKSLINAVAKY